MTALEIVKKFHPNVTKVVDAKKLLHVNVCAKDIANGDVKAHKECAIAVACKRAQPIDGAVIALKVAYLVKGSTATRYAVPEFLTREIVAFDRNGTFSPGDYYFNKPSEKLGNRTGRTGPKKAKTNKTIKYKQITQQVRNIYHPEA